MPRLAENYFSQSSWCKLRDE